MKQREPSAARTFFQTITGSPAMVFEGEPKSGWLRSIAVLAGMIIVLAVGTLLFEAAFYPWGRSLTGAPTLTGPWYGEMTTPSGLKKVVNVEIDGPRWGQRHCSKECDFDGTAKVCDGPDTIQGYTFSGDTENWSGTRFRFSTVKTEERPYGLRLLELEGEWSADTLRLTTTLIGDSSQSSTSSVDREIDASGQERTTIIGGHPDTLAPVTFTLRRGSEQDFLAACVQLTAQDQPHNPLRQDTH